MQTFSSVWPLPNIISAILFLLFPFSVPAQCNGYPELCDRRYDEVAYLTTHNAYNASEAGFRWPNQSGNVTTQLKYGVRALMLDVYERDGRLEVFHKFRVLGHNDFGAVLREIQAFLAVNEAEVVTMILECYVSADRIAAAVEANGLGEYLYTKEPGEEWPTLGEMVRKNKRLVLFSDQDDAGPGQEWYHYMWAYMVETHYSNHTLEDFSCHYNRGAEDSDQKDLFILNHFLTSGLSSTGNKRKSRLANVNPYFLERVRACQATTGKLPNFITVDFVELGDAREVVNTMNKIKP